MPDSWSQFGLEPCTRHDQASNLTMLGPCYLQRHTRSTLPFVDTDAIVYLALAPWTLGILGPFSLRAELAKSTGHHLFPFLAPYFFPTMKGQYPVLCSKQRTPAQREDARPHLSADLHPELSQKN